MKLINIYETKTSIIYTVMLPDNDGEAKIAMPKPIPWNEPVTKARLPANEFVIYLSP